MRDNDMVALMLFNPEATMLDLDASGINIENTGIKDEQEYLKLNQVRDNPKFKDNNGNFSDSKFHEFYIDALKQYNILAQGGWQPTFSETDIFAPAKLRKQSPDFQEVHVENPFQKTKSFKDIGEWGPQTKSVREIAEGQQVYNTETGEWMDSPETSFFGTIGMGPLVLATWDFDADENGNPTSDPNEVKYKKGTPKLNDKGTFYYETLGNRSSYGKDILHYSDIITKEDSKWNKIDFLDSDDLEKSVMGTVAKNVALVGSMFLPGGVGYAVTAATLLQQSLKLGATLGKMLLGSESQSMNSFQALISATDLHESTSDYARNKMWSWENLINTAGDAIAQLRQQRILFEAVPWALGYGGLGKGKGIFTEEGQKALKEKFLKEQANIPLNITEKNQDLMSMLTESQKIAYIKDLQAGVAANNMTKQLTNLSGAVSKAYMTGITVNDMFEEAKEAGMGDMGAIAMTLGYAAAEYALLSTGIGEMILPELRAQRMQNRQLLKNLTKVKDKSGTERPIIEILNEQEAKATTDEAKKNFFWKAFNVGKRLWEDNRSGTAKALTNATVAAFGEGAEEVSEEFLADAIRCIHDLGHWSEGKMLDTDKIFDRYAMNFVGGFIGGGVNGLATDFSVFNRLSNLSAEDSMKQLIYKINNGEADEIKRDIERTEWASKDLSATKMVYDEKTKRYVWQQAENERDSQNETIKTQLRNQINSIINVLEANGAKIKEGDLFDYNTLKEARFAMLANTSTAARYSEVFTTRLYDLIKNHEKSVELDASLTDEQKRDTESEQYKNYERQKAELEKERKEIVKEIDEIKQGKQAARFIGTALLEIHPAVAQSLITGPTLDLFVRRTHPNKKSFRELTDEEKQEYLQKYKDYKGGFGKDEIIDAYDTWERLMESIQSNFAPEVQTYQKEQDQYSQFLDKFLSIMDPSKKNIFLAQATALTGFFDLEEASALAQYLPNGDEFVSKLEKIQKEHQDKLEKIKTIFEENRKKLEEGKYSEITKGTQSQISLSKEIAEKLEEIETKSIKAIEEHIDNVIKENAERIIVEDVMSRSEGLTADQVSEEIEFEMTHRLNSLIQELTERNKETLLKEAINESREQIEQEKKRITDPAIQKLQELLSEKGLQEQVNILNIQTATSANGQQLYYLVNGINEMLDSVKESGYANPITKAKLKRALIQVNNLLDIYGKYMTDRDYLIGQESPVDKDIPENNVPIGMETDEYETTPLQAQYLSDIDYNTQLDEGGYLSDFLMGQNKLSELKTKIEKALEVSDSPVLKLLDSFALDVTGQQMNFSQLLTQIENEISGKAHDVNETLQRVEAGTIDLENVISNLEQASKLVDLLYSVLMGARSDSAGFEQNKQLSTDIPNFGFHFGINSIINEVKKKMGDDSGELLTIEGNITDNIVSDLHLLSKKLKFYKDLYGINSGQKLSSQPKITLRSNQLIYSALQKIYKAVKKLYDVAPNDIDTSMLDEFFNEEKSIIAQNLDKTSVDTETLEKIQKERINLEDALYDFVHAEKNQGKKLLNIKELAEIFKNESIILNESTEELSISSMIGYLASRMSIKSSDFYDTYRKEIADDLAPLTLQELEAYVHMANALNGDEFTKYKNQFRQELLEYLEGLTEDERIKLFISQGMDQEEATFLGVDEMKPYLKLLPYIPYYDNISFVEGIAGSGKTHGVLNMVKRMLAKSAPDLLRNVMIAHMESTDAENLAKELGLTKSKGKNRKELLEYISNWKEPEKNPDGSYNYKRNVDYIIEDGQIKSAYKLKDGIEIPSLLIIDEIGQYTDLELMTIDAFAKEHGISVLAFGDLDQNVNNGKIVLKLPEVRRKMEKRLGVTLGEGLIKKDGTVSYNTKMERGQMMHGFKLGFSMRTRSSQSDKNQAMLQSKIKNPQGDVTLHYYEGPDPDTGEFVLNGTKVYNYNTNDELTKQEEEVIKLVEKLIPTLKKDEKIGLIYQSKDSHLYKVLTEKYGDLIVPYIGITAQGKEAKYFIMETDWSDKDSETIMRELNTGITRGKNGVIVISKDPMQSSGIMHIKNAEADSGTKTITLSDTEIATFSQQQKQSFDRMFSEYNGPGLQYVKRNSTIPVDNTPPSFSVINIEKQEEKYIITVTPTKIENDWLKSQRENAITVKQFICDIDGFNVQIVFEEDNKVISIPGKITDYVDVTLEEDEFIPPTNEEEGHNSNEEDPVIVQENLGEDSVDEDESFDREKHRQAIEERTTGRPILSLYTVSGVETGGFVQDPDTGEAKPIDGSLHDPGRVDSMNGLIKMLGNNVSYEKLLEHLLNIQNAIHTKSRNDLEKWIKNYFKTKLGIDVDQMNLQFGMWTSSNKKMAKRYSYLERGSDERSLFNEIEDPNISRHTFSLLIKVKPKNSNNTHSLLIPLGFITSPFTLAQDYPSNSPIGLMMTDLRNGKYPTFNSFVEAVLNSPIIYQAHPELYNLFKLYHFDYAGFFPVVKENGKIKFGWNNKGLDTFSLIDSSFGNRGIQIMTERGQRQINEDYQLVSPKLSKEFVDIREWKKDLRIKTTSKAYIFTLSGKESSIQRKDRNTGETYKQNVIKGRPFILVSENSFVSDERMMKAYLDGDPSVKLVYLLPPRLTFQQLMTDLVNYENNNIDHFTANDATAFHILNILRKSELTKDIFEKQLSNVGHTNRQKVIDLLNDLEEAYNDAPEIEIRDGSRIYKRKDYSEFVNILKQSDNFFGSGLNLFKLRKVLRLVTSDKLYSVEEDEESKRHYVFTQNPEIIEKFNDALEEAGFQIYDTVKIKTGVRDLISGVAVEINTDTTDNFTINGGRPLMMDARVTTATFFTEELHLFIDSLVNDYIGELDNSGHLHPSKTKSRSIQPSLDRNFRKNLGESNEEPEYTPSENFKLLSQILNSSNLEGITIPNNPTNKVEEQNYINRAIEIINTTASIQKFVIRKDNGEIKIIDYSSNNCLTRFGTEISKKFTQLSNSEFELEFGNSKFTVKLSDPSEPETKLYFEDVTPEQEEQQNTVQDEVLTIQDGALDDDFYNPLLDENNNFIVPFDYDTEIITVSIEDYIKLMINYLKDTNQNPIYKDTLINIIATSNDPIVTKIRNYLLNNFEGLLKDGQYNQKYMIAQFKNLYRDENIELKRKDNNNEQLTEQNKCNKFSIGI